MSRQKGRLTFDHPQFQWLTLILILNEDEDQSTEYIGVPLLCNYIASYIRVETGSGHLGQLSHVLSGSSGSDLESALNHVQ